MIKLYEIFKKKIIMQKKNYNLNSEFIIFSMIRMEFFEICYFP